MYTTKNSLEDTGITQLVHRTRDWVLRSNSVLNLQGTQYQLSWREIKGWLSLLATVSKAAQYAKQPRHRARLDNSTVTVWSGFFKILSAIVYKVMTFSSAKDFLTKLLPPWASNVAFSSTRIFKNSALRLFLLNSVLANNREFIFSTVSISIILVRVLYKIPARCLFVTWHFQILLWV